MNNRRRRRTEATAVNRAGNRDPLEWTKLVFDYYKQIAALNGVGAALLLTLYRQQILSPGSIGIAIVLFGLGVLCCAWGMMRLLIWFPLSPGTGEAADIPFLAQLASNFFAQAVVVGLTAAFELPLRLTLPILVLLVAGLLWTLTGRSLFGFRLPRS